MAKKKDVFTLESCCFCQLLLSANCYYLVIMSGECCYQYPVIMPGECCSIYKCGTCYNQKVLSIFKIPSAEKYPEWRAEFLSVVTRDRLLDSNLKQLILKNAVYICERHFDSSQIYRCEYIICFLIANSSTQASTSLVTRQSIVDSYISLLAIDPNCRYVMIASYTQLSPQTKSYYTI